MFESQPLHSASQLALCDMIALPNNSSPSGCLLLHRPFTLSAVGYIASADPQYRSHLPLPLGRLPTQPIAQADDLLLLLCQA